MNRDQMQKSAESVARHRAANNTSIPLASNSDSILYAQFVRMSEV